MSLRRTLVAGTLALVLAATGTTPVGARPEPTPVEPTAPFDPDKVLVRWKDSASTTTVRKNEQRYGLDREAYIRVADLDVYQVEGGRSSDEVAAELRQNPNVALAEPDYLVVADAVGNDAQLGAFWGLENLAQTVEGQPGVADVDTNAPATWDRTTGDGVIVAVLDEGVDITHPELADRIWRNTAECDNDGVDDDGNGRVDDCNGWDFHHGDNTVFDPFDGDDHGTHVAGTIAAALDNNVGGAGVAPNAKIMPLKFLGPSGGATSDAITAIGYAQAKGARIVNNSWGGSGLSVALRETMRDSGMLFTTAAGNNAASLISSPQYPAAYDLPNQITVASIDNRGALSSFSNHSGTTSMGAPGSGIRSTIPRRPALSVGIDHTPGGQSFRTSFWGFGLEAVVGSLNRTQLLAQELGRLGATATTPIAVIDDDESSSGSSDTPDTNSRYVVALAAAGYTDVVVTAVTKDQSGPTEANLAGRLVIWQTGYASGTSNVKSLTDGDLTQLTAFVDAGGRLLVTGADAIYRNESSVFVQDRLGVNYLGEGDTRTAVTGRAGQAHAGMTLDLSGTDSPKGGRNPFQDVVSAWTLDAAPTLELTGDPDHAAAYGYKSGTSMAAPHVAGVAALVAELLSSASAVTVADHLKGSTRPLNALGGVTTTGGMVDASRAVDSALGLLPTPPPNPGPGPGPGPGPNPGPGPGPAPAQTGGYRFVASDGGIFTYGDAPFRGSAGGSKLNQPVVGMTTTPDRNGYWLVARDGGIFGFGAPFKGSTGGISLNQPIVGMTSTPSGDGYWLVASDGGIFAFGDARFFGSTGSIKLNQPIVGMTATPSGNGYWLVARDGGIFAFGDATFRGSTGGTTLNDPIVGMAASATGNGYWLVARDGGVFNYGDAPFRGSAGSLDLNAPVVSIVPTPTGSGYWIAAQDGGIFSFGDARFLGSTGNIKLNQPIVSMSR